MYSFHKDKARYFEFQYLTAREYIIPFLRDVLQLNSSSRVLEIGCAEAGVLKAFRELGCTCTGIELSERRTELAKRFHADLDLPGPIDFIARDIYDIVPSEDLPDRFDLVILKDVIEHIHDQERFIPELHKFLKPGGVVFFGFPPWYMPYGGHQQMCKSRVLSSIPYYHLLPGPLYRGILRMGGESDAKVANLAEIKETGISVERFERIARKSGFHIAKRQLWLLNPIYKYKFKKGPVGQAGILAAVPFVRNFVSTAAYYVIQPK